MDKITLTELPESLDRIYRAGISLCFAEVRDVGSVVQSVLAMNNFSRFVVGAGRPFVGIGPLPSGFQGIRDWVDLASVGSLPFVQPAIGVVTGYPFDDPNTSLYCDILSAFAEGCTAPLLVVVVGESIPHGYVRLGPVAKVSPPSESERVQILESLAEKNGFGIDGDSVSEAASALAGLDATEIRQIALLQLLSLGKFDASRAALEKSRRLSQGGFLEPIPSRDDPIGGLDGLKRWLDSRASAVRVKGLPMPRGVVLIGPPGTGKSLSAHLVSRTFGLPLVRLDVGRLFGSYVGESERNLRSALAQADALAPAILWVDEIEKGLSGAGQNGSEITRRLLQTLLTWMSEQSSGTFVFATANDISSLPPELLRKGRFAEIFYVDLPTPQERHAIWLAALEKPDGYNLYDLVALTDGYTGAEIAAAVSDALYESTTGAPTQGDLESAIKSTKPLSEVSPEQIQAIRQWGSTHARPAAGATPTTRETTRLRA